MNIVQAALLEGLGNPDGSGGDTNAQHSWTMLLPDVIGSLLEERRGTMREDFNGGQVSSRYMLDHPRDLRAVGPWNLYHPLLSEQAFDRPGMLARIRGLEGPLNSHLLVVMGLEPVRETAHWKQEVLKFIGNLIRVRSTKGNKPIQAKMYMEEIWIGPFGTHAEHTIAKTLGEEVTQKPDCRRNGKSDTDLAAELRSWHETVSAMIQRDEDVLAWIRQSF